MTRQDAFHRFLSEAKQLSLTDREKEEGRSALLARIALKGAASITLSADEKAMGRDSLIASMRLRADREPTSTWWKMISIPLLRMPALALSALIIVLGSGALAYASESAVPGDPLYSLKVDVLEPLRERAITSPEKRAVWQIRKVERRLNEAKVLTRRGKLTPQHRADLEHRISVEVVTLQQELMPRPAVETHVAAQEVLATTFEKYEESFAPASAAAASAGSEDAPKESEKDDEKDHLRQFVRERGNAARSEANFILKRAESDSSAEGANASEEIHIGITVSGSAKARSRNEDEQSEDSSKQKNAEKNKGSRASAKETTSEDSSADTSVDSSEDVSASAQSVSSAAEISSSSEEQKNLLQKVEEQREIIERGLLP